MWRGHWLSSGPALPGRTEVLLKPNAPILDCPFFNYVALCLNSAAKVFGEKFQTFVLLKNMQHLIPDEILAQIHKSGLTVSLQREVTLTEEQVRLLYFQYVNEDYFPALLQSMTR